MIEVATLSAKLNHIGLLTKINFNTFATNVKSIKLHHFRLVEQILKFSIQFFFSSMNFDRFILLSHHHDANTLYLLNVNIIYYSHITL